MKTVADSLTLMTELVLPTHTNALGTAFGGQILAWMDIAASICVQRHAGMVGVTVAIDELSFKKPIRVGQFVRLEARLLAAFRTSLDIEVTVQGENGLTGETWPCVRAFMTFVTVDKDGTPQPVPPLSLVSDDERARAAAASERRAKSIASKKA